MTLEYSTSIVLMLLAGAFLLTGGIIVLMKRFFSKQYKNILAAKHKGQAGRATIGGRTKYPEVDVFAMRGTFLGYGLALAMGLMIVAFGWTTREDEIDLSSLISTVGDEIEMETPRTVEPPPPPPPPPPPSILQIVESDVMDIETIEFEDMSISEETAIDAPVAPPKKEIPPPPPPPPPPSSKEIFRIVEDAPTFRGCEDVVDKLERKTCADEKLMAFIHQNIRYPKLARENSIQGMVVVQFVVEPNGQISNVKLLRDIGGGCGEEAVRVVKAMPPWNPGKQRGRAVRVMFTLPVKFKLA